MKLKAGTIRFQVCPIAFRTNSSDGYFKIEKQKLASNEAPEEWKTVWSSDSYRRELDAKRALEKLLENGSWKEL